MLFFFFSYRREFRAPINHDAINKINTFKESTSSVQEAGSVVIASTQTIFNNQDGDCEEFNIEESNVNFSHINIVKNNQDEEISLSSNQVSFGEQANDRHNNNIKQLESHLIEEDLLLENSTIGETNFPFDIQRQKIRYGGDVNCNRQVVTSMAIPCANWKDENNTSDEHELENNQQNFGEDLDWIIDIARPRIYWEDCRKVRYQEMLDNQSKDKDLRQLIERYNLCSVVKTRKHIIIYDIVHIYLIDSKINKF